MDGGIERASSFSRWWDNLDNNTHHSQWLHSTHSEFEHTFKETLTLVREENGDQPSLAQQKPQLMKNIEELHRLYSSLADHYSTQLSARSSLSAHSNPKSSVDDPEYLPFSLPNIYDQQTSPHTEELSRLVEENCRHLVELARRNEEKREANRDLLARVEKLTSENQTLVEQQSRLMDENGTQSLKLQQLVSANRVIVAACLKVNRHASRWSRVKTMILGTLRGGDSA